MQPKTRLTICESQAPVQPATAQRELNFQQVYLVRFETCPLRWLLEPDRTTGLDALPHVAALSYQDNRTGHPPPARWCCQDGTHSRYVSPGLPGKCLDGTHAAGASRLAHPTLDMKCSIFYQKYSVSDATTSLYRAPMSKSILFISKFPPTCGQVSSISFWLAVGLRDAGYKITACSDALFPAKQEVAYSRKYDLGNNIPDIPPCSYPELLSEHLFFPHSDLSFLTLLTSANRLVEDIRPDVLFSSYLEPYALVGHFLSLEHGIPHVVTHAGTDIRRLGTLEAVTALYRRILTQPTRFIAKNKFAASLTGALARPLAPYWPPPNIFTRRRFDRTTSDIYPTKFRSFRGQEPIFGFYSKFTLGKNIRNIVDAFANYRKLYSSGLLWLVGGPIANSINVLELIEAAGVEPFVANTPFLPNWRVPEFINACSCIVYMKDGYKVDGHGSIVPREVLSCGCHIIVTAESLDRSSFLRTNPLVHTVDNAADLAEIVTRMRSATLSDGVRDCNSIPVHGFQEYVSSWSDIFEETGGT